MINIAVLGYGVVGAGVAEVIQKNKNLIKTRTGISIAIKKILDIRDFSDDPNKEIITKNPDEIFDDQNIKIVVETIGGIGVAYEYTKSALKLKKHVVTSNKELVSKHGPELLNLAEENGVFYMFEASVGGGIPIVSPLTNCLASNEILGIVGILNGTTNYILTKMLKEEKSFEEALIEAKQNGYAEANPSADIKGYDTCRKIAILSSIAYNEYINPEKICTEGIEDITLEDLECANKNNFTIKLLAVSKKIENKIFIGVRPTVIDKSLIISNVEDVFNAVEVSGNAVGDTMFYGMGAGKLPTASAVVADIIDVAKHNSRNIRIKWNTENNRDISPLGDLPCRYFIRTMISDFNEAKKIIISSFDNINFLKCQSNENQIAFLTNRETKPELELKLKKLLASYLIEQIISVLPVFEK